MNGLVRKIFKNRYVYIAKDFAYHTLRFGLPMAVKTAAAKESAIGRNAMTLSRAELENRLGSAERVVFEPAEVLFTSKIYGSADYTCDTVVCREDMRSLYSGLIKKGKRVYVRGGEQTKALLAACGYADAELICDGGGVLVANSENADIFIPSPVQMFEDSPIYGLLKRYITTNRYMLGLVVNKGLFNSPFCMRDSLPVISEGAKAGYCVFAPLLYAYTAYTAKKAQDYDRLWFLAREGFFLKKLYDLYIGEDNGKSRYFLASRRAATVAAVRKWQDIEEIACQYYRGSFKNMMYARFGEQTDKDITIAMPEDWERVAELIRVHEDSILKRAERERAEYLDYIGDTDGKIAVADVGYKGTIQYWLYKMLGRELDGIYICSRYDNMLKNTACRCMSYAPVKNIHKEKNHPVYTNHLYLEAVLKAPYGQLVGFENGEPIYFGEGEADELTAQIQQGIAEFFADYRDNADKSSELPEDIFGISIAKGLISEDIRSRLYVEDSYCSDGRQRFKV